MNRCHDASHGRVAAALTSACIQPFRLPRRPWPAGMAARARHVGNAVAFPSGVGNTAARPKARKTYSNGIKWFAPWLQPRKYLTPPAAVPVHAVFVRRDELVVSLYGGRFRVKVVAPPPSRSTLTRKCPPGNSAFRIHRAIHVSPPKGMAVSAKTFPDRSRGPGDVEVGI